MLHWCITDHAIWDPVQIIPYLTLETDADLVCWNWCYDAHSVTRETRLRSALHAAGWQAEIFNAAPLREPLELPTKSGKPIKVFSAFWWAFNNAGTLGSPLRAPQTVQDGTNGLARDTHENLSFLQIKPRWSHGLNSIWTAGETAAKDRAAHFVDEGLAKYAVGQNSPGEPNTSLLSPYLHFGEIGPRRLWHAVESPAEELPVAIMRSNIPNRTGVEGTQLPTTILPPRNAEPPDPTRVRSISLAGSSMCASGLAGGADRRCHRLFCLARTLKNRLHAQPYRIDRRIISLEEFAVPLALWRELVLGHLGGRGHRKQRRGLAMGRRSRGGTVLAYLQPRSPRLTVRRPGTIRVAVDTGT